MASEHQHRPASQGIIGSFRSILDPIRPNFPAQDRAATAQLYPASHLRVIERGWEQQSASTPYRACLTPKDDARVGRPRHFAGWTIHFLIALARLFCTGERRLTRRSSAPCSLP